MNDRTKWEIWEIQAILYWILGVLILNLGGSTFWGWLSIGYGWVVAVSTILAIIKKGWEKDYEDKLNDIE